MNLQTTIDIDIKGFFQWWGKELAFLAPNALKELFSDSRGSSIFVSAKNGFTANFIKPGLKKEVAFAQVFELNVQEQFQSLKASHSWLENAETILLLNDDQAISKIIYLPEAAAENIAQVIGFELDRFTPFKADQVYYAAAPLGKTGFGQIEVLLALTPREILDELIAQLHALGVHPGKIQLQSLNAANPDLAGQYNLLPQQYKPAANRIAQIAHGSLTVVLVLLLAAIMVYPVWHESVEVDQLKAEVKNLEKQTRVVDEQQHEIQALQDESNKLIEIKDETPELVEILNELSRIFKDDTWLTNLQYSEKHMQIHGQSPAASSLISVLESNPYFSKAAFVSPLTQDKVTGQERFQISVDVNAKPEKPTLDAAENPTGADSAKDAEKKP